MEVLIVWLIFAAIPAAIAPARGRRAVVWFVLGLLFSPLITLIFVLLLPSKKADNALRAAALAALPPQSALTPVGWQEPKSVPAAGDPSLAHWGEDR